MPIHTPTLLGNPLMFRQLQNQMGMPGIPHDLYPNPQDADEQWRQQLAQAMGNVRALQAPPQARPAPPPATEPPREQMLFDPRRDDPRFQGSTRQLLDNSIRINELRGSSPDQTIFLGADIGNAQRAAAQRGAAGAAAPTASFKGSKLLEALQRQVAGLDAATQREVDQAGAEHYRSLAGRNRAETRETLLTLEAQRMALQNADQTARKQAASDYITQYQNAIQAGAPVSAEMTEAYNRAFQITEPGRDAEDTGSQPSFQEAAKQSEAKAFRGPFRQRVDTLADHFMDTGTAKDSIRSLLFLYLQAPDEYKPLAAREVRRKLHSDPELRKEILQERRRVLSGSAPTIPGSPTLLDAIYRGEY